MITKKGKHTGIPVHTCQIPETYDMVDHEDLFENQGVQSSIYYSCDALSDIVGSCEKENRDVRD